MKKIDISNVIDIKDNKLFYRNIDRILFIDLEVCAHNYESACTNINKSAVKVRCVGERFFCDYAYYELYTTDEHTQIFMNLKNNALKRFIFKTIGWNFYGKAFQRFYTIQKQLNANGYTTLDLS